MMTNFCAWILWLVTGVAMLRCCVAERSTRFIPASEGLELSILFVHGTFRSR